MLRKVITLIILSSATLLSSCAKTIFDNEARCPFVDKGGCQSMEMVNKMVTERRFTPDGAFVQHFKEGSSNKNYSSYTIHGEKKDIAIIKNIFDRYPYIYKMHICCSGKGIMYSMLHKQIKPR